MPFNIPVKAALPVRRTSRKRAALYLYVGCPVPNRAITSKFPLIFGVAAIFFASSFAAAGDAIPSHCKETEIEFLTARMHRTGTNNVEAILSLCGDSETESPKRMTYRFGPLGKIEMELIASAQHKAGIYKQSDKASHAGLISIVFFNSPYAYEVSEGIGMTSGVRLNVYRNKKEIVAFESYEYESKLLELKLNRASSTVFKQVGPIQPW